LQNHIAPVFGKYGLASIKPTMVQQWIKDLQTVKGLAPSTIETIYVILASIMRGAVRDGISAKTPCDDIRLPEIIPAVIRLVTPAQVLALAAVMPRRYALLVPLGAGAGLRQGEAFGLAVDGIDIAAGMITVSQQVIVVDRCPVLAPPKTSASVRDVPMPTFLRDAIISHISDLALADGDVLCRAPRHTLLRRDYYDREIWKPALACTGLAADMTFHD
jgi:integrase